MKTIGIISDTHRYMHPNIPDFFEGVDEIWHAGDIGSLEVLEWLKKTAPVRLVYGNIDDQSIRQEHPEIHYFSIEGINIFMIHIGGYPGKYEPKVFKFIQQNPVELFISGHSHILKVMPDKKHNLLHINPGAAGLSGFHKVITAIRITLNQGNFENLKVFEAPRKGGY
jgi:hypothetical protein